MGQAGEEGKNGCLVYAKLGEVNNVEGFFQLGKKSDRHRRLGQEGVMLVVKVKQL